MHATEQAVFLPDLTAITVVFFNRYILVEKKIRIYLCLILLTVRLTLLQIKIIHKLFTLSSRHAKDN